MQFTNAEEFWNALARLYDSTLELKETMQKHELQMIQGNQRLAERIDQLAGGTERLLPATETLHKVADSHERRLDRAEITVEAILEDLRRSRG
jgi:hypothetical protein